MGFLQGQYRGKTKVTGALLTTPALRFRTAGQLMEWGRLYARLPDDPRVQAAEDDGGAAWLLIQSMCYVTSAESEGFIPDTQVPRFGGPRLKQRVEALTREELWVRETARKGYVLDPVIWTEERNLSDAAERKRERDRLRIAAKRAATKAGQNGHGHV
jgi:hypothetical protein